MTQPETTAAHPAKVYLHKLVKNAIRDEGSKLGMHPGAEFFLADKFAGAFELHDGDLQAADGSTVRAALILMRSDPDQQHFFAVQEPDRGLMRPARTARATALQRLTAANNAKRSLNG